MQPRLPSRPAPGYDLATGLGSPNVYSLVNAPQWSGGGLATNVTLALSQATIAAGQSVTLLATVTDQGRLPVLGGTVTFYSGNTVLGSVTNHARCAVFLACRLAGSTLGGAGTYQNIFASYAGGVAEVPAKNRYLLRIAVGSGHGRGEPGTAGQAPSPAPGRCAGLLKPSR